MVANDIETPTLRFPPTLISDLVRGLRSDGFSHASGRSVLATGFDPVDCARFTSAWARLVRDHFMGDNGIYRYRRYAALELDTLAHSLTLAPHGPYRQPSSVNKLNGDLDRYFEPIEDVMVSSPVTRGLLFSLAEVFDKAEGACGVWDIRLHPYRIIARPEAAGLPTPEGLHRDGVDWIVTVMIGRTGVVGGETTITDLSGKVRYTKTLAEPFEILVANDLRTMHAVSPLLPAKVDGEGSRDVLVVGFTRIGDTK